MFSYRFFESKNTNINLYATSGIINRSFSATSEHQDFLVVSFCSRFMCQYGVLNWRETGKGELVPWDQRHTTASNRHLNTNMQRLTYSRRHGFGL